MPKIIPPFTSASDRGYKFLRVFDQYYVARGGRLVLYVEGGIAPYDWVVTGTDFTLDAAQTNVQYNFIGVDDAAVLDNTETVTITDANNESVTITCCTCNPTECEESFSSETLDYTNFTEVDENADITVGASSVAVVTMRRDAHSHVSDFYDDDYFGDFVIRHKVTFTAADAGASGICLGVSDAHALTMDNMNAYDLGIAVEVDRSGANYRMNLRDRTNNNVDTTTLSSGAAPGARWIEFERAGTTATVKVYTDAYVTLADTLTITCGVNTYSNLIAVASRDVTGVDALDITFTVETLQIRSNSFSVVDIIPADYPLACHSAIINTTGGCPPYLWEVESGDIEFEVDYTNNPSNRFTCPDPECVTGCEFTIKITDANSNVIYSCCGDPTASSVSWDSVATVRTVAAGGNINIYIFGSCGPFTWEIVSGGTNWTLDSASTTTLVNVLNVAAAGYDCFCTVRVSDRCGDTADFEFFVAGGSWSSDCQIQSQGVVDKCTESVTWGGGNICSALRPSYIYGSLSGARRWKIYSSAQDQDRCDKNQNLAWNEPGSCGAEGSVPDPFLEPYYERPEFFSYCNGAEWVTKCYCDYNFADIETYTC